jgi:hypothetical protein
MIPAGVRWMVQRVLARPSAWRMAAVTSAPRLAVTLARPLAVTLARPLAVLAIAALMPAAVHAQGGAELELAIAGSRSRGKDEAARAELRAKLRRTVRVAFDRTPLLEAVSGVCNEVGADWVFDPATIKSLMIEFDRPVTLPARIAPAKEVLDKILENLQLRVRVENGVAVILSEDQDHQNLEHRTHFVSDLLIDAVGPAVLSLPFDTAPKRPNWIPKPTALKELLEEWVDPDSWDVSGGDGLILADLSAGSLLITAKQTNHERIEHALAALRVARERCRRLTHGTDGSIPGEVVPLVQGREQRRFLERWHAQWMRRVAPFPPPGKPPGVAEDLRRTLSPITLPDEPMTMEGMLGLIATTSGLRLELDPRVLSDIQWSPETPVEFVTPRGRPNAITGWLLDQLVEHDLQAAWSIEGNRLWVFPKETGPDLSNRRYDVRELIQFSTGPEYRVWTGLTELTEIGIDPDSWEVNGGDGVIRLRAERGVMDVTQTLSNHRQLSAFLELLRETRRDHRRREAALGIPPVERWLRELAKPDEPPMMVTRARLPPAAVDVADLSLPIPLDPKGIHLVRMIRLLSRQRQPPPVARTRRELLDGLANAAGMEWQVDHFNIWVRKAESLGKHWLERRVAPKTPDWVGVLAELDREVSREFDGDGRLLVSPGPGADLSILIHPAADLVRKEADPIRALGRILDALESDVDPDSWDRNGGDGRVHLERGSRSLVIVQTPDNQLAIHQWLERRRRPLRERNER